MALLYHDQWMLIAFLEHPSEPAGRITLLIPPPDRFWADPHVISAGGRHYIFFEEYVYKKKRGHISLIVMDEAGGWHPPTPVLERPYHLSYPFVFAWQGEYYMMPESAQNGAVEVYRCVSFPTEWEFCKSLLTGVCAVDPTLLSSEGQWWLFAGLRRHPGVSAGKELFLFSADHPLSDSWRPHPCNPVVSDLRRARPAGRLFERDGTLYRPSQDCSRRYGSGLNINRVIALNDDDYRESLVSCVKPEADSYIRGVHTVSHGEGITLIDAKLRWPRFGDLGQAHLALSRLSALAPALRGLRVR